MPNLIQSAALFERACGLLPGGVKSPVRAFGAVGGTPRFIERAKGCRIYDADGNAYVDYVLSWGPALLGHAPAAVVEAVTEAAAKGLSFGAPCEGEVAIAERIRALVPCMDMLRMVNSGTEATMSALRLARGFTGRDNFVKFAGCYHGHADAMLVAAGSGALTQGVPNSAGVPADFAAHTIVLPYNDVEAVRDCFRKQGGTIAAVFVEPIAANMGLVLPAPGFLETLRALCDEHGALLVFDEVITGFRLAPGGAQQAFGIAPDLSCFGKIIGGGMPVGCYGGRADVMRQIAPLGPVYQAGTLSGNPVAMAAGIATLDAIRAGGDRLYADLVAKSARLADGLQSAADDAGIALQTPRATGIAGIFFAEAPIRSHADLSKADAGRYARFFHGMLERGFAFAPSAFEAIFLSSAHDDESIDATIAAARDVFAEMAR